MVSPSVQEIRKCASQRRTAANWHFLRII